MKKKQLLIIAATLLTVVAMFAVGASLDLGHYAGLGPGTDLENGSDVDAGTGGDNGSDPTDGSDAPELPGGGTVDNGNDGSDSVPGNGASGNEPGATDGSSPGAGSGSGSGGSSDGASPGTSPGGTGGDGGSEPGTGSDVPAAPPAKEVRALWVTGWDGSLRSQQGIHQLLQRAEAGGINVIYAQVARRADAYYPSAVLPYAHDADPGFDALAALIDGAHARGMEVHAWSVTLPVWHGHYEGATVHPSHVWLQHGPTAQGAEQWVTRRHNAGPTHYLDPGHPDAVAFVTELYLDIARRYPVDGIHLDYIRYEDISAGYNPVAVARFQAATGFAGIPSPSNSAWTQWRADQVTHVARHIYLNLLAERPDLVVSAAVITGAPTGGCSQVPQNRSTFISCSQAAARFMQYWPDWAAEGIFDVFVPMNYFRETQHAHYLDGWLAFQKAHAGKRKMVSGIGAWLNTVQQNVSQIQRSLNAGGPFLGVSLFSYQGPASDATQDAALSIYGSSQGPLSGRPDVPVLPWKAAPTTGHVLLNVAADGQGWTAVDGLGAALVPAAGSSRQTVVQAGHAGWVDVAPGSHVVQVTYQGQVTQQSVQVQAGKVTVLNLSLTP